MYLQKILIFLITFTKFALSKLNGKFDSQELDRQLKGLQKVIDYMAYRPEEMNLDAIFGLTLAEAHMMSTLSHPNVRFLTMEQKNHLTRLLKISNDARQHMKEILFTNSKLELFLNEKINEPKQWVRPILWKRGFLKSTLPRQLNANLETVEKLILNGKPNETESDYCVEKLLKVLEKNTCRVTNDCETILLKEDNPQGYATTHRLLLVIFAKNFHCEELKTIPYDELIPKYCSLILQNLVDIEGLGFPPPTPDLVMEEVVLCGAEGYLEFVNDHWSNIILNWQQPGGCFSSWPKMYEMGSRTRRSSNFIDFGCQDHTTGLGAASIALFIRQHIETAHF